MYVLLPPQRWVHICPSGYCRMFPMNASSPLLSSKTLPFLYFMIICCDLCWDVLKWLGFCITSITHIAVQNLTSIWSSRTLISINPQLPSDLSGIPKECLGVGGRSHVYRDIFPFILNFIYLLIHFRLHWVSVAMCWLSLVAVCGLLIAVASLVAEYRL